MKRFLLSQWVGFVGQSCFAVFVSVAYSPVNLHPVWCLFYAFRPYSVLGV